MLQRGSNRKERKREEPQEPPRADNVMSIITSLLHRRQCNSVDPCYTTALKILLLFTCIAAAWVHVRAQHMGFAVDNVTLEQIFSEYFGFPANHHPTNFSIIIFTRGWRNRPISGRSAEWTPSLTVPIKKNSPVPTMFLHSIFHRGTY
jgi:hypothetical protein